jgi:outer membrane chaperone skp (ompH)
MIALALFLGATTMLTAQVKIAHIDVQKLLEEMPERKSIESQLKKMEQGYMNDIQAAIKELQAKAQKYQNEAAALTEAQLKLVKQNSSKNQRKLKLWKKISVKHNKLLLRIYRKSNKNW